MNMNFNADWLCDLCGFHLKQHIYATREYSYSEQSYVDNATILCPVKICIVCGEKKNVYTGFMRYRNFHHTCKDCTKKSRQEKAKSRKLIEEYLKDHPKQRAFYT